MKPHGATLQRVLTEDALKHLLDCEQGGGRATLASLAGALGLPRAKAAEVLAQLRAQELAEPRGEEYRLTEPGRHHAIQVVRYHRLYETWLARHSSLPPEKWHRAAHRAEHRLDQAAADRLADRLGNPRFDPHGDPIPTREGDLPLQRRTALPEWPDGADALVEHLEDEPEAIFRQIGKLGLHPGMILTKPFHQADGSVICRAEGRTLLVAPEMAALVHVAEVPPDSDLDPTVGRLAELATGASAVIHSLSPACTGAERRRLLDLGLVPGTPVRCEFTSPFGSPRAYFLRGSLVALRREQAERILVRNPAPA